MKKIYFLFLLLSFHTLSQNPLFIPDTLSGNTIDLSLQSGTTNFYPGNLTETFGVNGNLLGPTLILQQNQSVTLNVTNNLVDTTTVHWHGLHVSPENDGGPHTFIVPNTTWSPSFTVKDWAATYWYHPHLHSHTNEQVLKGIAGMIIVRDDQEALLDLPRKYGVDDIPLVLQTKQFDANNQIVLMSMGLDTSLMVNGTIDPVATVPEQVVRLRILNGSSERVYNLGLSNNQVFYQIASDGGLLSTPVSLTRLQVAPGERAEILVNFSGLLGQSIQLMSYGAELPSAIYGASQPGMGAGQTIPNYTSNPLNGNNFQVLDFSVVASTSNPVTSIPVSLTSHTPWLESNAAITRNLIFTPQTMGPNALQGPFLINNQAFNMMMINYTIPFENTEIWSLQNNTPIAHPFHIHDIQFYILDINGAAPPANLQGRKDVILVPAGGGTVRFIAKFEDFSNDTIPYMYHCHMLPHEDGGMMGQFIVSSPNAGFENNTISNKKTFFPNPASTIITINDLNDSEIIKIMDNRGKIVYQTSATSSSIEINIEHLINGLYFVELESTYGLRKLKLVKI